MSHRLVSCLILLSVGSMQAAAQSPIGPQLQRVSVNVFCPKPFGGGSVQGSGTVLRCDVEGQPASWVLTAHHVVRDLREVKDVIDPKGESRKQVRYRDAQVIQEQTEGGRGVGEIKFDAKVISVDPRRDIALLRVRKGDFARDEVKFYLDAPIPPPGSEVLHAGAPGGKEIGGTCSLTAGIISRLGVRIPEFGGGAEHGIFDQSDVPALPGSSGGMVALKQDGRWIGMITLGLEGGDSFHWLVPIRSVREWAKDVKVLWLLDPAAPRPTEKEIEVIPLELDEPGFPSSSTKVPEPTPAVPTPGAIRTELPDRFLREKGVNAR